MAPGASFSERVASRLHELSPAAQRVVRVFREHREEVLYASAATLAAKAQTSDATVVRTTRALGYSGLDELRRALAAELKQSLSPAGRMQETLRTVGGDLDAAFAVTLDIHREAVDALRRDVPLSRFRAIVELICGAPRVVAFGLGPSGALAEYFAIQLGRFGFDHLSLTRSGLLFADDLHRLRRGDVVVILAYSRVYPELDALLEEAGRLGLNTILITDTLGPVLGLRVDIALAVARGRADMLSMHAGTLALLETLLVGIAAARPGPTLEALTSLNRLRTGLSGEATGLPQPG